MSDELKNSKLVSENYLLAYRIAQNFHAPYMGDDIKENVAFKALQYAAEHFDAHRGAAFSTFLNMCVRGQLKSEALRFKRLPYQVSGVRDEKTGEDKDIFEFIDSDIGWQAENRSLYDDGLLNKLQKRLTDQRNLILKSFLFPEQLLREYVDRIRTKLRYDHRTKKRHSLKHCQKYCYRFPKRMTWAARQKVVGKSAGRIAFEMKSIRLITLEVLKENGYE